jgi:hypothetical protein
MSRISFFLVAVLLVSLPLTLDVGDCRGQSTAIASPENGKRVFQTGESYRFSTTQTNGVFKDWPPSTMPRGMKRWEAILDSPAPSISAKEQSVEELIEQLRTLGLPFVLSTSAKDDSVCDDDLISLPMPNLSIRDRLLFTLEEKNATITFRGGLIKIISLDDDESENFAMTITYDVTTLGLDYDDLADHILDSVDTESWMENGGLGMMSPVAVGNQRMITVTHTYRCHRKLRSLLAGLSRLGNGT